MLQTAFWYYLLIAPHVLLVGVLIVLCSRKHYREHPIFFAYVVYELAEFSVVLYMVFSDSISVDRYWRLNALLIAGSGFFRFGVIYELYSHVSKNYPSLENFCKFLFRGLSTILLFISVSLIALVWPGRMHELTRFVTYVLDRGVNILQVGLILGLFGIAKFFSLSWRKHVFGITLGFGFYLSVQLIATAVQTQWGFVHFFDYVTMAAYHVSVLIWLYYMLIREEATDQTLGPKLQAMPEHADIAAWNSELERLLHHK
jgi:hypothetical protein